MLTADSWFETTVQQLERQRDDQVADLKKVHTTLSVETTRRSFGRFLRRRLFAATSSLKDCRFIVATLPRWPETDR